ncbi:MAG: polysaccharide biosynthesis protein, partial [Acidimicrobiales bacterium]
MATPGDSDSPFRPGSAWTALIEHRFAWLAVWDSAAWVVALFLGTWARYEFQADRFEAVDVLLAAAVVVAAQVLLGLWQGLYLGRWRLGSFEEIAALLRTVVLSGVILLLADANPRWVPISVPVIGVFIAIVGMAAIRYGWRLLIERKKRPTGEGIARMLVFGAGEGAEQIITAMLRNPDSPYLPVAIIDDDPRKARLRVRNISVQGTRHQIAQVAANNGADVLLIAVPSADGALVRELAALGENAGLQVMAVPTVSEMLDDQVGIEDIRPLTTADLLGRREIDTDVAGIADYLAGRRVLITGAGGSIGSELCRQVHRFEPAALVMLDRDESALHAVQLSIHGRALLETRDVVVADIRDAARLDEVFAEHRPEVVFHAAALKHLPLCELHPTEAVKTNVWGTASLLELALRHGVATFVNISTDKAADPTSVLGATKRIAERLTAHAAGQSEGDFISVRFGNVLGSRGSVLGSFHAQIEAGGPVTVTDPEVTRFFMTVEEAVQLVIQAGAIGEDGRAMVLDMGEPVKIAEVA